MHGLEALLALVVLAVLVAPFAGIAVALRVRRSLRDLETRVLDLERRVAPFRSPAAPVHAVPAAPAPGAPPAPRPAPEPPPAAPAPSPSRSAPADTPSGATPPDWRQWESWLGGTWLNRVGALILVLGIGFFRPAPASRRPGAVT